MKLKEYIELQRKGQDSFLYLRDFIDGLLTQEEYLDSVRRLDGFLLEIATFTTDSFEDFCTYYQEYFPSMAEERTSHEKAHAVVAEKYGLRVTFGHIFCDRPLFSCDQPFIVEYLGDTGRDWEKQKILTYIKEANEAISGFSHGDEIFKDILADI